MRGLRGLETIQIVVGMTKDAGISLQGVSFPAPGEDPKEQKKGREQGREANRGRRRMGKKKEKEKRRRKDETGGS